MTENERAERVDAANRFWCSHATAEEQLSMLVDLYPIVFTTIGEPRHLPHPDWFPSTGV
jgi:hypothetical protein